MAEEFTVKAENGEIEIADTQSVDSEVFSNSEELAPTEVNIEPAASGPNIPPILVKGLIVAGGYAAYRGAKAGIRWIKGKLEEAKENPGKTKLTKEERKIAEEAYRVMKEANLSDETILFEAGETAKLYSENKE